jgi:hypothetical protein
MWRSSGLPEVTSTSSDIWREVTFIAAALSCIRKVVVTFIVDGRARTLNTVASQSHMYSNIKPLYTCLSSRCGCRCHARCRPVPILPYAPSPSAPTLPALRTALPPVSAADAGPVEEGDEAETSLPQRPAHLRRSTLLDSAFGTLPAHAAALPKSLLRWSEVSA